MKALILAGGFGTRLKDVAKDIPKPMVPVLGKPFIEHQIATLREQGVTNIVLAVHHMSDKIKSYFGNGKRFNVDITYSDEDIPLGTAGAIKKAQKYLDDTFIVLNGDSYLDIDIKKMMDFHNSKNSKFTIALTATEDTRHSGNVVLDGSKITSFLEKPEGLTTNLINAGVYIFEPRIFEYIEPNTNVSLERDVFPKLAAEGALYGIIHTGYFIDIGRPETYKKFCEDSLNNILVSPEITVRSSVEKMVKLWTDVLFVTDDNKKLLGVITQKIINRFLIKGGSLETPIKSVMATDIVTAKTTDDSSRIQEIISAGVHRVPIIDENGVLKTIEFKFELPMQETYPIVRGKAPLRISFAGGGTDLPYFFEKYGGIVINATINKYCHASIIKRADSRIILNSDSEHEIVFNSKKDIKYDGKFDVVKAVVNVMKPDFGFELYFYSDIPTGRGLGSSASLAVLTATLLSRLQGRDYDEHKIAQIAFKAETEELKIKGGWQDQYAAAIGGFSFMEFNKDKTLIYPLKLKPEVINEFNSHLMLCYVGNSHFSGNLHKVQETNFQANEEEMVGHLNALKKLAAEVKDCLLLNDIETIGKLMHESWERKKKINSIVTNPIIEHLYNVALQNGAYGGRLLGAGGGGYLLLFHSPKMRNHLKRTLENEGGEIVNFDFEFNGTTIFPVKSRG